MHLAIKRLPYLTWVWVGLCVATLFSWWLEQGKINLPISGINTVILILVFTKIYWVLRYFIETHLLDWRLRLAFYLWWGGLATSLMWLFH